MKKYIFPICIAVAFFALGIFTLSDYGMNWDSPGHWLRGQAYAHLFLTGKKTYGYPPRLSPMLVDPGEYISRYYFSAWETGNKPAKLPGRPLPAAEFAKWQERVGKRLSFYQDDSWNGEYFLKNDEGGHPPFANIVSAGFNLLLHETFGLVADIESYQLFSVLISTLGVVFVGFFAFDITHSRLASLISSLSLALFPLYIIHAHINTKDPLQATFFTGCLWAFWHWIVEQRRRWFVLATIFFALALGIKWNILFLPFILIPWLFLTRKTEQFKCWFETKKLILSAFTFFIFIFAFLIFFWPSTWADPIGRLTMAVKGYWGMGVGRSIQPNGFTGPFGINFYLPLLLLSQTPEIILVLASVGIWAIRKSQDRVRSAGILILLWLFVPLTRVMLPQARTYGGLIQIMEVLPALAVLSGIGAYFISQKLKVKNQSASWRTKFKSFYASPLNFTLWFFGLRLVGLGMSLLIFALLLFPITRFHPNENAYFNSLAGGLRGAAQKNLVDWTLTYGNVYKQGVAWLNAHAEDNADLAIVDGSMFAISPLWLRHDISISPDHFSGFDKSGEYLLVLNDPETPAVFAARYLKRFLSPVHEVKVGNFSLLTIYKNDERLTRLKGKERVLIDFTVKHQKSPGGDFLEVDLGKNYFVNKIAITKALPVCLVEDFEWMTFVPEEKINDEFNPENLFVFHERKKVEKGDIIYFLPAEKARLIKIFPQSQNSCFVQGQISVIYALDDSSDD